MSDEDQEIDVSPRALLREVILCAAALTLWPLLKDDARGSAQDRMRALAMAPLIGLAVGVILAGLDGAMAPVMPLGMRSIAVLLVAFALMLGLPMRGIADTTEAIRRGARVGATGISGIGPVGAAAALGAFALEAVILARIASPAGRASALVMAQMLGRFAIVPAAYGLKPLERWGLGLPYEIGVTFREFAASSIIALGLTTILYRNVGLIVVIVFAIVILLMRLVFSRRLGGVAGYTLGGASAVAEIAVMATVGALTR
jgi:adenosylcobinamide-GDP ribazoletransferase